MRRSHDAARIALSPAETSHKWLGVLWKPTLDFEADMYSRLHVADRIMVQLVGLVSSRLLPFTLAMELFVLKVNSILACQRWLWIGVSSAQDVLNSKYYQWAWALLGAEAWNNGAVASSELGWRVLGFDRVLLAAALRRAKLWSLQPGDLYGDALRRTSSLGVGWRR